MKSVPATSATQPARIRPPARDRVLVVANAPRSSHCRLPPIRRPFPPAAQVRATLTSDAVIACLWSDRAAVAALPICSRSADRLGGAAQVGDRDSDPLIACLWSLLAAVAALPFAADPPTVSAVLPKSATDTSEPLIACVWSDRAADAALPFDPDPPTVSDPPLRSARTMPVGTAPPSWISLPVVPLNVAIWPLVTALPGPITVLESTDGTAPPS